MGGLMILIGIIISTLMWADLNNIYIWVVLFVCTSLGLLGFMDDYFKIKLKNSSGINAKIKMFKNCEHKIPVEGSSLGLAFLKKNLL